MGFVYKISLNYVNSLMAAHLQSSKYHVYLPSAESDLVPIGIFEGATTKTILYPPLSFLAFKNSADAFFVCQAIVFTYSMLFGIKTTI